MDKLQRPETKQTAQTLLEEKQPENKNGRKSIFMDIPSDKQMKSHTSRLGYD